MHTPEHAAGTDPAAGATPAALTVTVNGGTAVLAPGTTVAALVAGIAPDPRGIAVSRNREVVPRSQWEATALVAGDRVEIVTAAAGG